MSYCGCVTKLIPIDAALSVVIILVLFPQVEGSMLCAIWEFAQFGNSPGSAYSESEHLVAIIHVFSVSIFWSVYEYFHAHSEDI